MGTRRVRIYSNMNTDTSVIGFSHSASDAPDNLLFVKFMQERNYRTREMELKETLAKLPTATTLRHIEVQPPLSEEHMQELGALCIGNRFHDGIVDPSHDGLRVAECHPNGNNIRTWSEDRIIVEA